MMANINAFLDDIETAVYGEEVRGSIVKAIQAILEDTEGKIEEAKGYAEGAANSAIEAGFAAGEFYETIGEINSLISEVNQQLSDIQTLASDMANRLTTMETLTNAAKLHAENAEKAVSDITPSGYGKFPISSIVGDENNNAIVDESGNPINGIVYIISV